MIYPKNYEQKIGFDSIRMLLKEKCLSTLGEQRVEEMSFSNQYDDILNRLNEITEFIRIIQEEDSFPNQFFFDIRPSLHRVKVEGMFLDENELFDLKRSLETIRDIIKFLSKEETEDNHPYPALKELAGDVMIFPQLIDKISNLIDKFGRIKDNASTTLLQIRRDLSRTSNSISHTLNSILRSAQSEGFVDKDVTPTMQKFM